MIVGSAASSLLALCLTACSGVTGKYDCKGGFLETISLESGGKAVVSANLFGVKQQKTGTYTVNGNEVAITIDMTTNNFTRDGKTLNGGPVAGTCTAQ